MLSYLSEVYLKHLMAVMVEINEAKKAAEVVIEVTHIVSNEWLRAEWTITSSCSSTEFKLGSAFEWAFHALTRINVSSAPTPKIRKKNHIFEGKNKIK